MLSIDPFGIATHGLSRYSVVPPHIAACMHLARRAGASIDDNALHGFATLRQRLVDRSFKFDGVSSAPSGIGGNDELRAGIFDPILDGVRGKSTEYDRMHGADARAGLHRNNGLGDQWHVDNHAIATTDPLFFERVGELAYLLMQLRVGQLAYVAGLAFENNGELVAAACQMHIQAIVRHIQLAVGKPTEIGRARVIQRHRKWLFPVNFSVG